MLGYTFAHFLAVTEDGRFRQSWHGQAPSVYKESGRESSVREVLVCTMPFGFSKQRLGDINRHFWPQNPEEREKIDA